MNASLHTAGPPESASSEIRRARSVNTSFPLRAFRGLRGVLSLSFLVTAILAGAQPLPKIQLRQVFPKLECSNLVWMTEAPDGSGRFAIVGQDGRIVLARKGTDGSDAKVLLDIEDRQPHASLEQGLLSLAFHPGFKTNSLFYIFYSQQNPRRTLLSEFKISASDPDHADTNSERILLDIPQPSDVHKAGLASFGPDGFLYLGVGDGGGQNDEFGAAQNTSTLRGKILRIDVNTRTTIGLHGSHETLPYGIPADNPFFGEPDFWENSVRKEIWAYGLRNPWRYSWDRQTGDLWAGDVGQDKWEEIDLIVKGGNYGWGVREGAHHFKPGPDAARYIDPVMEYPHNTNLLSESAFPAHSIGASVTGGYVYRGAKHPALRGIYIYGDYALGTIWGFRYQDGKVTESGTMLEQPKNITSFAQDLDGELYVLAYEGQVYSIAAAGDPPD
ncbi:MAG TPA: PQQ-dependent sugar dehydrogenase [Candidatus Baltobacteraceae bacterium]|jgi:glucose/arabinose dehydrogenase|nr:PQQ-dependent sugar dehydrogenase [Candidatus Baltobacteraceae bacterium]